MSMAGFKLKYWILLASLLELYQSVACIDDMCSNPCSCFYLHKKTSHLFCNNSITENSNESAAKSFIQAQQNCDEILNLNLLSNSVSKLTVRCNNVQLNQNILSSANLTSLSITSSSLQFYPSDLIALNSQLQLLNLSNNILEVFPLESFKSFSNLQVLDISQNKIFNIPSDISSIMLTQLYAKKNLISDFSSLSSSPTLTLLDVSFNPVSFKKSKFNLFYKIDQLFLQSVPAVQQANWCSSPSLCNVLPPTLSVLDLSNNNLFNVPSCHRLLSGLKGLQVLYLDDNLITFIKANTFQAHCLTNLTVLSLHNNRLVDIDSDFTATLYNLQSLILSKNYLQHISPSIIKKFSTLPTKSLPSTKNHSVGLFLNNNPWSCDCFQKELLSYLNTHNFTTSIECYIPTHLRGKKLLNLKSTEMTCKNASLTVSLNLTTTFEYQDATLECKSSGVPKPLVSWNTPDGTLISLKSLSLNLEENLLYNLSSFGERLVVKNVRLSKTGIYRCFANNNISTSNSTVGLSVILSNVGTIAYLVITCITFFIAIVLNSVNMFMYIHHYIKAKREYKRAVAEVEKEQKLNPPIRHRSRSSVDESVASLNANKHYGKYDFTCQQMFLDTVIKGAYSVKKTIYDARHSEFSANMWEYAANLRDRLHIELPTQLPTISMPNISMPSIPTMQDINTNIERLGSSVMTRSHNLASSVGSVFTLKRWMWQQPADNSSDSDSKSSDENLDKPVLTEVQVDVHSSRLDGKSKSSDDDNDVPTTSKQPDKRELHKKITRFISNRGEMEVIDGRSSKSLPDYGRRGCSDVKVPPAKTVTFLQGNPAISVQSKPVESEITFAPDSIATVPAINVSVENRCHSYETSV